MTKITGWLTAIVLASALALPANAASPNKGAGGGGGGGGQPAAKASGGGGGGGRTTFSSPAGRSFSSHAGRSFSPRVGRSANFATVHRGTTFNHSVSRTQRLNRLAQPNTAIRTLRNATAVQTNAQRTLRRNGTAGITPLAAKQGRFASRFGAQTRVANLAAHRAWRHGHRAGFVAWYGPVFWPYAYSDIFDYAFWPGGYDDGYWDYAYDGFVDGLFWGEYGPPDAYAYAPAPGSRSSRVSYAGVQELCTQPGTGITAWPYSDIERKVGLNADQKQLLDGVRKSGGDAAATFKASCPAENMFPLTPPGRLTAMTGRLQATLDAVKIVQPALDGFYASLSNEQKARFDRIGQQLTQTGG